VTNAERLREWRAKPENRERQNADRRAARKLKRISARRTVLEQALALATIGRTK
jgi:hypothetical protein